MKKSLLIISMFMITGAFTAEAQKAAEMPIGRKLYIQSAMNYGKNYGGYWDVPGKPGHINKGLNIQIWTLDKGHDRTFTLHNSTKGYYEIQVGNTHNARVDISNGKKKNGTNVRVWERNGANAQKFKFHHLGNGRFKIYDKNGKVLCLAGRKNSKGSNVHIWDNHNGPWMEWYLIDVETKRKYYPRWSNKKISEVKIGEQIWMGENLNVSHFRNGDPIPHARTKKEWDKASKEKKPAWCYLNNNPANGRKSGKLYNWFAVNDPRGLAPEGWHIPSKKEWSHLIEFLGGWAEAIDKLKAKSGWASYETIMIDKMVKKDGKGDDTYGFTAIPGGFRWGYGPFDEEKSTYWFSSSPIGVGRNPSAFAVGIHYKSSTMTMSFFDKDKGLSVRCIKNK